MHTESGYHWHGFIAVIAGFFHVFFIVTLFGRHNSVSAFQQKNNTSS
jgi:hypothetical protein